eukprot:1158537-Pelagomonas_calceolata.AAC.10
MPASNLFGLGKPFEGGVSHLHTRLQRSCAFVVPWQQALLPTPPDIQRAVVHHHPIPLWHVAQHYAAPDDVGKVLGLTNVQTPRHTAACTSSPAS